MMLQVRTAALDESAQEFIGTFMSQVASVTNVSETRARIETLLLSAITLGDGSAATTWSMLHRAIAAIVPTGDGSDKRGNAHAYLQSFIRENADLADE